MTHRASESRARSASGTSSRAASMSRRRTPRLTVTTMKSDDERYARSSSCAATPLSVGSPSRKAARNTSPPKSSISRSATTDESIRIVQASAVALSGFVACGQAWRTRICS